MWIFLTVLALLAYAYFTKFSFRKFKLVIVHEHKIETPVIDVKTQKYLKEQEDLMYQNQQLAEDYGSVIDDFMEGGE